MTTSKLAEWGDCVDDKLSMLFVFVESGGIFAPLIFIFFHLLRQFIFIPAAVVCIGGGILFGTVFGTLYSIIGLTLLSLLFYICFTKMPRVSMRLSRLKIKWFGPYRNFTIPQISILRLIPFVHYQLLNFCLYERKRSFKEYAKGAFLTNIPLAFFYTVFGEFISRFTPTMIVIILFALSVLVYLLREKKTVINWHKFFKAHA